MDVQLLQTVPMDRVEQLLEDPAWCLQQKYDGQRCLIQCQGGQVVAQHRNGMPMDLGDLVDALPTDRDYTLDAEAAWGKLWVFDEISNPAAPYVDRLTAAARLVAEIADERIVAARTWRKPAGKRHAFAAMKAAGVEGVVLKRLDAPHAAGTCVDRAVRYKFVRRIEAVILGMSPNGKQSIVIGLYDEDGDGPLNSGSVPLASVDQLRQVQAALAAGVHPVVEVEYLYVTKNQRLFQPRFIRVRPDKTAGPGSCGAAQLVGTHAGEHDGPDLAAELAAEQEQEKADTKKAKSDKKRGNKAETPVLAYVLYGFTALILLLVGCSRLLRTFSAVGGGVRRGASFGGASRGSDDGGGDW